MSTESTICSIFKRADNRLLARLFKQFGADESMLDVDAMKARESDEFYRLFEFMPKEMSDRFVQVLERVKMLATKRGMETLEAVGQAHSTEEWRKMFTSDETMFYKSLSAWLNFPSIFIKAVALFQIESGRWTAHRDDLTFASADLPDQEAIERTRTSVREYLRSHDGRGTACSIRTVRNGDWFYVLVYPDDHAEEARKHDESGELIDIVIRKKFTIVFGCNPEKGSICLKTEGGVKFHKELMELIFRALFDRTIPPKKMAPFDLSVILQPNFRFITDSGDSVDVQAKTMTVLWNDKVEDEVKIPVGMTPWKASMARYEENASVKIVSAKLHFTFLGESSRRRKSVIVQLKNDEIRTPFGLDHEFLDIVHKYLDYWRITHAG